MVIARLGAFYDWGWWHSRIRAGGILGLGLVAF